MLVIKQRAKMDMVSTLVELMVLFCLIASVSPLQSLVILTPVVSLLDSPHTPQSVPLLMQSNHSKVLGRGHQGSPHSALQTQK